MDTPNKLAVSINEAAALLSVSRRTIENYIQTKRLPARKIGRRTVVLVRSLETFLRTDQPSPLAEVRHE
jgi:excisionase family DNA binding protein